LFSKEPTKYLPQARLKFIRYDGVKANVGTEINIIKEGIKTVIVGKPNVGKSTLLNALLHEERAIVTHVAGTTRDVIEEIINIKGIPLVLVDTAGMRKKSKVSEDLEFLRNSYLNGADNSVDDTSPTFKAFEEGSEMMSKESNMAQATRLEKFIRDLKNALIRIENKTYGVCRVTGKLIDKERLKAVPHATLSIEAKNMQ